MSRIPKQNVSSSSEIPFAKTPKIPKIVFSFESLDRNEFFDLPAKCERWSIFMMDQLKVVSGLTVTELRTMRDSKLRFHDHENANPPVEIPNNIAPKDMCQIRFGTNRGGVHGVFVDNIFYIIWLDPFHNMYPSKKHGGLKKIPSTQPCYMEFQSKIDALSEENEKLNAEIDELLTK